LRSLVEKHPSSAAVSLSKMVDGFSPLFIYQAERRPAGRNSLEGDSSTKFGKTKFHPLFSSQPTPTSQPFSLPSQNLHFTIPRLGYKSTPQPTFLLPDYEEI
jgi:hypothetical protein